MSEAMKRIEFEIARRLEDVVGGPVEVTNRGLGAWTLSGAPADVIEARAFLIDRGLMVPDWRLDVTEDGEMWTYLVDAPKKNPRNFGNSP